MESQSGDRSSLLPCPVVSRLLSGNTQPPVGQNYSAVTKATGDITEPTTGADTSAETT